MDLRAERVIAAARLVLALTALASLMDAANSPERLVRAAPLVAGLFAAYSAGLCVWLLVARGLPSGLGAILLCADLVWFSALVFVGGAGYSPYPILYVFVLLSAGLRWGMRETLVCAGICSLFSILLPLAAAQAGTMVSGLGMEIRLPVPTVTASALELNALLLRTVALLVVGYLIGYLAEREKRVKRGLQELAVGLAGSRVDHDLSAVVSAALTGLRDLYRAHLVTAFFYDSDEEELVRCEVSRGQSTPRISEVPDSEIGQWVNLDNPRELPPTIVRQLGARRLHWTHFAYQRHLGWLFIVDPQVGKSEGAASLQQVANQMGPVLDKMFLLRRVCREAIEEERNRIAHDFHDGPLQSFYSFELYLEVLQHWLERDPERAAKELAGLREAARSQALELREFVQNMRPVDVEGATLLTQIRALADDLQKTSKLTIRVMAASHRIRARRRLCREIYQIAREALNNVRKHAQASHAIVTLEQNSDSLVVTVDDDGRGFNFQGTYDLDELDDLRLGPISIKKRVRALRGQMTLESQPGLGSRLAIRIPLGFGPSAQNLSNLPRTLRFER